MKETEKDNKSAEKPSYWRKLYRLLNSKERVQFLGILFLQILASISEVIGLGAIPAFILALSNPAKILEHKTAGPILSQLGVTDSKNLLIWGGLAMIVVFILKNLFSIVVEYIKVNYLRNLQIRISRELFYRYMYAEYTYLLSHNTAELLRSCMSDVSRVVLNVVQSFLTLFMNIVLAINLIVVLFVMEPISSLLTVVVIGSVSFIFLRVTRNKLVSLGKRAQEAFLDIIQAVEDGLSGIKETRVMQAESMFINAYNRAFRVFSRSEKIRGLISSAIRPIFEILLVAALLSITAVMFLQNKPIGSIIPMLATFSVAMVRLMPSIREITSVLSTMRYALVSIDPILSSMDIPLISDPTAQEAEDDDGDNALKFTQTISVENLTYFYPNTDRPAVDTVSFEIKKGETVAFVGGSGAGKTTLLDLITGLLPPTSGRILADGNDITDRMRLWQKNLGYIPQFIFLADISIKENILWGRKETAENLENYREAIVSSQLEELVNQLPQGDDTIIGERGTRLSGGQRQRIGIARAIFRDPEVLIMDEATASLDSITEKEIADALVRMKGQRTILIVAHRLSTVRNSDRLYLMDSGRIIDSGSYDELYGRNETFRKLHGTFVNSEESKEETI